jgi:hypothetical protein
MNKLTASILSFTLALATLLGQQTPPTRVTGSVTAVDAAAGTLKIKADDGTESSIKVTETSRKVRKPADSNDLKNAPAIELKDIVVGDRALASGSLADGVITVRTLVVMPKSDVEAKQKADAEEWAKNGTLGLVSAVDPSTNSLRLKKKADDGKLVELVVNLAEKADIKQYAPDSLKFSDAKPAQLQDISVNDQVRIKGEKSADGVTWKANAVVFGKFRLLAGTVKTVDVAKGILVIDEVDTKKPMNVSIRPETSVKKMQPMAAFSLATQLNPSAKEMLERFATQRAQPNGQQGQGGPNAGGRPQGENRPQGEGRPQGENRPQGEGRRAEGGGAGMGGGMMGMNSAPMSPAQIAQMMERQPKMDLKFLKEGDAVLINASVSQNAAASAISIISGVDALLFAMPSFGSGGVSTGLGQAGMAGVF